MGTIVGLVGTADGDEVGGGTVGADEGQMERQDVVLIVGYNDGCALGVVDGYPVGRRVGAT